ncbi:MAG: orotidine-5'-phosphate decarboxylase [Promethearchaeota archaeon]
MSEKTIKQSPDASEIESFADRLITQIIQKQSIICVGLDPRIEGKNRIPDWILQECNNSANDAIWRFNRDIIDATYDFTPVYKPQIAFYEQYDAIDALKRTIDYVHEKGCLAILDAKRNDIGSTSEAYAKTVFEFLDSDAVTVNSYFGIDGVAPFLKYISKGKGVIVLLKTSNNSSGEFQDLFSIQLPNCSPEITEISDFEEIKKYYLQTIESQGLDSPKDNPKFVRNYIQMTRLMKKWSEDTAIVGEGNIVGKYGYSSLGGVVGATYPTQMVTVRHEAPRNFILIPGYGTQGGKAADIAHGVNQDGLGAIVNASRSIDYAYQRSPYEDQFSDREFAQAARAAAKDMRKDINSAMREE